MSKQVNIKNQNKLKVYLAKEKKNDIKPVKEKSNEKKVRNI
jgi:hypothetical protein